jgi:hypothetical protein
MPMPPQHIQQYPQHPQPIAAVPQPPMPVPMPMPAAVAPPPQQALMPQRVVDNDSFIRVRDSVSSFHHISSSLVPTSSYFDLGVSSTAYLCCGSLKCLSFNAQSWSCEGWNGCRCKPIKYCVKSGDERNSLLHLTANALPSISFDAFSNAAQVEVLGSTKELCPSRRCIHSSPPLTYTDFVPLSGILKTMTTLLTVILLGCRSLDHYHAASAILHCRLCPPD